MARRAKEQKHIGVYQKPANSGIWYARYVDVDGQRKARCCGTFADACNFYEENKARIRRGVVAPAVTHRGIRIKDLVADALLYSAKEHKDVRVFKQRLEVIEGQFGHRVAESITPVEIQAWFADMEDEREWTAATQNRYRAAMSKVFKIATHNRKAQNNPARLVPQRKESAGRLRFLAHEEEARLRAKLVNRQWAIPQLDVALSTGMRKGEQFSVTLDQVDFTHKFIYLDETKNGSSRYVHLNSDAVAALKWVEAKHASLKLPPNARLFVSKKNKPIQDPRMWFSAACEEAKIKGVTWHTLRHTFASRLVMAGVDLKTIQELMGHKTIAMTARYAHLSPAHKLAALEALTRRVTTG